MVGGVLVGRLHEMLATTIRLQGNIRPFFMAASNHSEQCVPVIKEQGRDRNFEGTVQRRERTVVLLGDQNVDRNIIKVKCCVKCVNTHAFIGFFKYFLVHTTVLRNGSFLIVLYI